MLSARCAARVQKALLVARTAPRLALSTPPASFIPIRAAASTAVGGKQQPADHSTHFKIERVFAAGMVPLIPAAYFIHGPVMDALLTTALVLHIHWGISGVVHDYARPFVIGEGLTKVAHASIYVCTILLLAGLLHFNTNDVGLTKAFELVFSL